MENSSGFLIYREVNKITREKVILIESSMSSKMVGKGKIISSSMAITATAVSISLWFSPDFSWKIGRGGFNFSAIFTTQCYRVFFFIRYTKANTSATKW